MQFRTAFISILSLSLLGAPAAIAQAPAEAPAKAAQQAKTEDRWYVVELSGSRTGFMHVSTRETESDITTKTRMQMAIARGDLKIEIKMDSETVETLDGKPIRMTSKSKMAQMAQEQTWTFKDGQIEVATTQAGRTSTRTVPAPTESWLTPGAAERYGREQLAAGAKEIVIKTMDPQMGPTVVTSTRTGFEPTTLDIAGDKVEALKTKVSLNAGSMPIDSTEYIDSEGNLIRSITSLGGMAGIEIVMTKSTKADATGQVGAGKMPEIMVSTFVKPDRTIERSRESTSATFTLHTREGKLPELPNTGSQTVTKLNDSSARVSVITSDFAKAEAADATNPVFLGDSAMIDTSDEKLKEFVAKALKGKEKASDTEKALALRTAVHDFINEKSLGVGMATASEVVRTREGDCSEHGVLLAAALRVTGIRSRVATGLIYADEFLGGKHIFGYHMWSQALLPNNNGELAWTDLDATLRDGQTYDATHITIGVTSLDDKEGLQSMMGIAGIMGNLDIKVESVSHDQPATGGGK